ncbi:MAG: hypothetical protein WKF97_05025 [Chitinophagaceae bacterium]
MEDRSATPEDQNDIESVNKRLPKVIDEEDGRNKEWQDRARVNIEEVPEGTRTNVERDFEPDQPDEENNRESNKNDDPVY